MAIQSNFFGKRDSNKTDATTTAQPASSVSDATAAQSTGSSRPGAFFGGTSSAGAPSATASTSKTVAETPKESKLTVGPNIKLKGVEITDCDVLFIEGVVEATMDSQVIQIAPQGYFKGAANIDVAEIRGTFEGELKVRDKLTVFSGAKITGSVSYGKLVVEEGASINGDIRSLNISPDKNLDQSKK